jgi:hypothetical protein
MAKTLDQYLTEITTLAGGEERSVNWYRDQVRQLVPRRFADSALTQFIRKGEQDRKSMKPIYGTMNFYYYEPKHGEKGTDKLPYYDVFPLVIPIKRLSGGFLGINFHYLSIPLRIKLLERIEPMAKEGRMMGWGRVARLKLVKPCIKRYITGRVGSRFLKIDKEDFLLASLLPVQSFKKETWRTVHRRSRSSIY